MNYMTNKYVDNEDDEVIEMGNNQKNRKSKKISKPDAFEEVFCALEDIEDDPNPKIFKKNKK